MAVIWPFPEDLSACVKLLKKVEEHRQRSARAKDNDSSDSSSSSSSSDSDGWERRPKKKSKRKKKKKENRQDPAIKSLIEATNASVDMLAKMVKGLSMTRPVAAVEEMEICAFTGARGPAGICWECGDRGHRRIDCPQVPHCVGCKKRGHSAETCNVPVCQRCDVQHYKWECPRKSESPLLCAAPAVSNSKNA